MKYLKDIFKISVFVLIVYTPFFLFSLFDEFANYEKNINQQREEHLLSISSAIETLLKDDRVLESCQRLAAEQQALNIHAYSIISPEGKCDFPTGMELVTIENNNKYIEINKNAFRFVRKKTRSADWAIYVHFKSFKISDLSDDLIKLLIKSIANSFLQVIYIVIIFSFLAVLLLTKSIQNRFKKNGLDPIWLKILNKSFGWLQLHDLKILSFATSASLKKSEDIKKDQDLLETSLEYSILNEIRENNHQIPYSFSGTVAKVDINGFSKVVAALTTSNTTSTKTNTTYELTKHLENFGCELLQRYHGLFEKTIGDEIVVVFKGTDSALLATAFARDLMHEFSKIEFDFNNEKRKFTLKSAISSSEITFSKRISGYGFLGDAFIYATRLLDTVTIKDRNILSCTKDQSQKISDLALTPAELRTFDFKNMPSTEGYLIENFISINEVYEQKIHLLKFFRSNESIIFLLHKVQTEKSIEKLETIFYCLSLFKVRECTDSIIETWIQSIKLFEKRAETDKNLAFSFSKLIIDGSRLIPAKQWTVSCTDSIISISRYIEGRVNASIVDVLIDKELNQIAIEQEKSFIIDSDTSFRTRGNLIINQAIHKLDNSVFEKVIKMIKSNSHLESSTGVYSACQIIMYYQKENPAELETYSSYRKLSKILDDLAQKEGSYISPRLVEMITKVKKFSELSSRDF